VSAPVCISCIAFWIAERVLPGPRPKSILLPHNPCPKALANKGATSVPGWCLGYTKSASHFRAFCVAASQRVPHVPDLRFPLLPLNSPKLGAWQRQHLPKNHLLGKRLTHFSQVQMCGQASAMHLHTPIKGSKLK